MPTIGYRRAGHAKHRVMTGYLTQHLHTFLIDIFRLFCWLAILAIIFVPLERLFALHPQRIFRREIGVDLGYFFLNGLLPALLMSVPLAFVAWGVRRFIPHGLHDAVAEAPFWARAIAGLVVGDVGYYWGHRLLHAVPLLWRFHSVHHSAEQIDFLVNTRAHPIDMVFGRLSGVIPLYVLGLAGPGGAVGSAVPVLIILVGTVWGFFIHANVRWHFGPLAWAISTPEFHRWHHAVEPADRNFASMLPIVDRVFGTIHMPRGQSPARYGIKEDMPSSIGEQLLLPFMGRVRPSEAADIQISPAGQSSKQH
jgi:sterol desaturase/sphingolipid hydroxylase (fatty acid hydroxylase superfamily)